MEMIAKKIEAATLNKTNLIEIFSVGKKYTMSLDSVVKTVVVADIYLNSKFY